MNNRPIYTTSLCILLVITLPITGCWGHASTRSARRQPVTKKAVSAGYAIQIGAFKDVGNAERLAGRLQQRGISAFYFRKQDGLFAVRFGEYQSHDSAQRQAAHLVKDGVIDSFYIAPPVDIRRYAERKTVEAVPHKAKDEDGIGPVIAQTAERFIGIPYRWGGNTVVDGLDCSGFSKAVYNLCGISIPRTAQEQFHKGDDIDKPELQKGDLVFFGKSSGRITHVGIYIGEGKMVHAPKRGEDIQVTSIVEGRYSASFIGARRYI